MDASPLTVQVICRHYQGRQATALFAVRDMAMYVIFRANISHLLNVVTAQTRRGNKKKKQRRKITEKLPIYKKDGLQ